MRRAKSLAWIGGVGLLGLTPAMVFAQGLPQPPSLESAAASQVRVAPGTASQDVVQTGGTDQRNFRPRDLLQQGVENYRKGEYEVADVYLKKAQEFRGQLSQAEQRDLDASLQRNGQAIELRKQGQDQIKRASEAFNAGRHTEATALIKSVQVNQYVRAEDKQSVAKLGELIAKSGAPVQPQQAPAQPQMTSTNPQMSMPQGRTPADMVKHARMLCTQGDFDGAQMWAMSALQSGAKRGFFWEDSAEKVLRDVEAGRKRTGTAAGQSAPATNPNAPLDQRQQQARQLCMEAKRALDMNDLARAKALTRQAESLNANLSWVEDYSPQKMNQLIASREANGTAKPMTPSNAGGDPRAMLREAKIALDRGDVERAEQLAMGARGQTGVKYSMFETNPESMLAEVAKVRETLNGRKAAELLVQSRSALNAGNLDEAERLASQSKMLKGSYSVLDFGDRPDKVLDECRVKRQLANRNKSLTEPNAATTAQRTPVNQPPVTVAGGATMLSPQPAVSTPPPMPTVDPKVAQANRLMMEARQHLNRGEHELALNKAMTVKSMGVVTLDKPEDIYLAVKSAQESRTVPSPVADAKRTKALQLMAGARLKVKSGDILGARKEASEAKSLGAIFHQGDDLPEAVMAELDKKAREQVDTYSKAAETLAQRGRHGEAQQYRNYVANVAMTFNVPAPQMAAVKATPAPANVNDLAMQGSKICAEIDGCLKDGQYTQARKLANALAEGPYGQKVKANEYLVRLDAEETKAAIKTTEQHFDLFVRAMNRKDYDVARSYAEKVDKRHLDAAKGKQFHELLANPSYQQHLAGNENLKPSNFQSELKQAAGVAQDGPAGKGSVQSPLLDELKKKHEIEYQRLRAMTQASLGKATRLSQNGNVDAAVAELKGTLETIKKADPDVPKVVEMTRQLETAVNRHQKIAEQIALERERTEALTARKTAGERRLKAEESRREQIATLMREAKKLMHEGKYTDAEALAEKAKAIDPDDVAVDTVLEYSRRARRFHDEASLTQRTTDGNTNALHDLGEGMVVPVGNDRPMAFGPEFTRTSPGRRRAYLERTKQSTKEEFPSNSRMGSTVSIDFRNKPLEEAIDELRVMSGVNMIIDATALAYAGVDTKAPITLTLNGVSLKTALDCLLQNAQLTYVIHNGIIKITTREAKAKLSNEVRHMAVHDLITPRDDMAQLANHNPDAKNVSGNANESSLFVAKDVGYNGPSNSGGVGQMDGSWKTRRTGQTLERQLENLITTSIAPETWKVNGQGGQGTIEYFPIGMTFVISQQSDVQEQIEDLLRRLRELQEVQITVEVRILTLTDDFFERMGVDFNVLIPDKQTAFDRMVANANFAPNGMLNSNDHLKGVIVGLTPNGNFTNNLDIPISNDSFRQARLPTGFAGIGPPGSAGGLDIGVAFLSSIQVFLVMEAVQGDVRNSTLQAPKITLFNGQVASISSFREELFVTSVTAIPNFFTGIPVFIPNQQRFQSGVFLTLQAVVTHDRRYVQLTLSPNIQRVEDSGRTFQAVAGITLQQPVTSTITLATTVMVPDGGTILVGGLKTMQEQRREFGPPILSKIPYLNRLFRNQSYGKSGTSLMFMVTPRIIINEEEEEKLGNTFSF